MWPLLAVFVLSIAKESNSIFGGTPARIEDHPYEVFIEDVRHGEGTCVGSIVSEYFILTSAVCAFYIDKGNNKKESSIRAGSNVVGRGGIVHKIDQVIMHENFHQHGHMNIAVVRVKKPFQYEARIKPIEMFNKGEHVKTGTLAIVSGLEEPKKKAENGRTQRLQALNVTVFDYNTCKLMKKSDSLMNPVYICAKNVDNDGVKALGQLDDGSPLVVNGRLAGVSSWVSNPHDGDEPTMYVNVALVRDWIDSRLNFEDQVFHAEL